jgi:putative ABC transport system permease protein
MQTLARDVRYAVRMLMRSRSFTMIAVVTLALGIGANTAIFSIVYTVLLKPLPYEQSDRLMMLWGNTSRNRGGAASAADFLDWRKSSRTFEEMSAVNFSRLTMTGRGEPVTIPGARVNAQFFKLMRVAPALGRTFTTAEDRAGGARAIVLSQHAWQTRFSSDPKIIGRTVVLDGNPYTVVGVMPAGFDFPAVVLDQAVEYWVPLQFDEARADRGGHFLAVVGRLRDGVQLPTAQAEINTIAARLEQQYPDINTNWVVNVIPIQEQIVGDVRTALYVLIGAVGFVLLIACANVANLLLARAAGRARELAVRAALGASRRQLLQQLLTESVVLSVIGAVLGLILASWALALASSMTAAWIPRASEIAIDVPVLAFTVATAVLTGMLFGVAPGLHVTRTVLSETLKGGARSTGTPGQQRLRAAFVVGEIALAFVLLIGAGLLIRSFQQMQNIRPGFEPDQTLTAVMALPQARYTDLPKQVAFTSGLLARLRATGSVRSAALSSFIPMDGKENLLVFSIDGQAEPPPGQRRLAQFRVVSDGFFETLHVPLRRGRTFTAGDVDGAPRVAIVSQLLADKYFPATDPIGQRVTLDDPGDQRQWFTVVGVVDDVRFREMTRKPMPLLYMPAGQVQFPEFTLVARTAGDPMAVAPSVRAVVRSLDPAMPVNGVRTLEQVVSSSMAGARFRTRLLACFALIALLLSAIGVYGVMSYSVEQRSQEMGLRMALGARPSDVLRLVTGHGVRLAAVGIVLGLAAAFWVTRLLESLLFGVSTTDPVTFGSIAVLLGGVALLASVIPARRATRADPMAVLRTE